MKAGKDELMELKDELEEKFVNMEDFETTNNNIEHLTTNTDV